MSHPIDPTRCIETVYARDVWCKGSQCSRKRVKGTYCTQHHPDSVKKRQDAQAARYKEKEAKSPWRKLEEAVKREKKLEARLKKIVEAIWENPAPSPARLRDLTKDWL